jgi:hypothetical protein
MAFNGQSIQRRIWRAEHLSAELQKHAQRGDEPKCLLQPRVLCQADWIILRLLDAPAAYRDVCLRVWKSLKHGLTVEPQYITHHLVQRARNLLAKALQTTYAKPAWVCDIRDVPAYYHFTPRPDNVPEMDEQTSYVYSKDTGVSFCLGGNGAGCLGAEQEIYDPVLKVSRKVSEIDSNFHVWARTKDGQTVIAKASQPRVYGTEDLYRVTLHTGEQITVTLGHRVLTESGWKELGYIVRDAGLLPSRPLSDVLKLRVSGDAFEQSCGRILAAPQFDLMTVRQSEVTEASLSECQLSPAETCRQCDSTQSLPELAKESASCVNPPENWVIITSVEFLRRDVYWDFSVEEHENYWMAGAWHHNTTTTSLLKACKFMLETPPPRRNTPFWFIAESYEQIGSIYDEKIAQFGLIPPHIIDKDRIHWNKRNNNWPFRVPLISPEGPVGRNWTMEFKGWRQGRGQFQARAVGGFCFIEQFPWVILDETLRGAREFNIPGSKMAEYTPVDPSMSQEIEEMIENGVDPGMGNRANKDAKYLPEGWKVYHMNTKCAKDHGHVSEAWFKEFFSMIPDSMLDVRMKGLFASFEGVIYPEFMPQIHCCGDEIWPIVHSEGTYHLRCIDWGTGPDNPFVCLWIAVCSDGTSYVYDEYYSNSSDCTIIDHLVNVQEQWEWSNSPQFGMTYADPSDPGNFRIASRLNEYARKHCDKVVKNISMGRAKNAVYEGIEHVRLMLKPSLKRAVMDPNTLKVEEKFMPRLMIHKGNCPNLVREMKAYRWMQPGDHTTAANPRNAPRQPCKFNDHACLTADSLVRVSGGVKRIGDVRTGDTVFSRYGACNVVNGWTVTRRQTPVIEVLTGKREHSAWMTPDHRLFVPESGWTQAAHVQTEVRTESGTEPIKKRSAGMYDVGCIATEHGEFMTADGLILKNCDALRYGLFTHASAAGATIESIRRNSQMRDAVDDHSVPVIEDSAMESYAVSRRADVIGSHRKRGND